MLCAATADDQDRPAGSLAQRWHHRAPGVSEVVAGGRHAQRVDPVGHRTSMWSACGMRSESATMPPHGPDAGPNPNAARVRPGLCGAIVEHFAVSPSRHSGQVPHEIAHGTTTTSPSAGR